VPCLIEELPVATTADGHAERRATAGRGCHVGYESRDSVCGPPAKQPPANLPRPTVDNKEPLEYAAVHEQRRKVTAHYRSCISGESAVSCRSRPDAQRSRRGSSR